MLVFVFVALLSHAVHSLPAINFTDTAVPNQMIKTLSEAQADPRGSTLSLCLLGKESIRSSFL